MFLTCRGLKILANILQTTFSNTAPQVNVFVHDDVIKWKHFSRNWPFERGIHRSLWIPHTKASDAEILMFSLICVWINGWVNNREADDLRRHHGHCDINVMLTIISLFPKVWWSLHWVMQCLAPYRQKDIAWTNVDQVPQCTYKSPLLMSWYHTHTLPHYFTNLYTAYWYFLLDCKFYGFLSHSLNKKQHFFFSFILILEQ